MLEIIEYLVECTNVHLKLTILILVTVFISSLCHRVKSSVSAIEFYLLYGCSVIILGFHILILALQSVHAIADSLGTVLV